MAFLRIAYNVYKHGEETWLGFDVEKSAPRRRRWRKLGKEAL